MDEEPVSDKQDLEGLILCRNKCTEERSKETFDGASKFSGDLLDKSIQITNELLSGIGEVTIDDICFVAVGSVGRDEALPASDLDLIPVCTSDEVLDRYRPHDGFVRKSLGDKLGIKVSAGSNLTKAISLDSLLNPDTIGGSKDNSRALTRRILVLTEGKRAGGQLPLRDIRAKLLDAYAGSERTRGKHVLSLCNDIGRYYRTLCIEYKAKVDVDEKDWCTRNLKLRHSRKLWYFSSMMSIVALASTYPDGRESYKSGLLRAFALSPTLRLVNSVADEHSRLVGKILDHFACFLDAMSEDSLRKALSQIDHGARYENDLNNPFPAMKHNSDALHTAMSELIQEQEARIRQRILDWFLL